MVMVHFTSKIVFAGSILFWVSTANAEKLPLDDALAALRELAATTDVQQQILTDRNDPAFVDVTESYEGNLELGLEKAFPSENWDISLLSAKSADGTFRKVMRLWAPLDDVNYDGTTSTICQEVNSLLVSEFGEPNMTLDTSTPLPDDTNFDSMSNLRMTWNYNGLGVYGSCLAYHVYMPQVGGGKTITNPVIVLIELTEIEDMETLKALSPVTCRYQGTLRTNENSRASEQALTFDFYLNETDHELLGLDKRTLASDVLFTDSEIIGVWDDTKFEREFRINRFSGVSSLSVKGAGVSYNSSSGECIAHTERKF